MERINYPQIVQEILQGHSDNDANDDTEVQLICDTERHHYQVLHIGWKEKELRGCLKSLR